MPKPILIDVSLRDGGYLNQWEFSEANIVEAIRIANAAEVDFIEVGYLDDTEGLPATAACSADNVNRWKSHTSKGIVGMIRPAVNQIEQVLKSRQGCFDLLRIPVDLRQPQRAVKTAQLCHDYGFACTFNFTSANCFSLEHITECARQSPAFLRAIYLADSRGAMRTENVKPLIEAVQKGWSGDVGYHAHNNLNLARETTQEALKAGCRWIDASIAGVGLGGRNLSLAEAVPLIHKQALKTEPQMLAALAAKEQDIALPPPGETHALFKQGAEHNLRMEWIAPLFEAFGKQEAHTIIATLPAKNWFEPQDLKPFLSRAQWERIQW